MFTFLSLPLCFDLIQHVKKTYSLLLRCYIPHCVRQTVTVSLLDNSQLQHSEGYELDQADVDCCYVTAQNTQEKRIKNDKPPDITGLDGH